MTDFANDKDRLAHKREAFGSLREKREEIAAARKALESVEAEESGILEVIHEAHGGGPFKLDGLLVRIRKVKGGDFKMSEIDTEAEEV